MAQAGRDLLDRLELRVPALSALVGAAVLRAPAGSRLRRRLVNSTLRRRFAAMNRSDVDLVVTFYERDAEVSMRGMAGVGISERYVGHDGVRAIYADIDAVFSEWSYSIRELADRGRRMAIRADFVGHGRSSGAETRLSDVGTFVEFSRAGRVARQTWFVESGGWRDALAAIGDAPSS
jgi:hypothetical protein